VVRLFGFNGADGCRVCLYVGIEHTWVVSIAYTRVTCSLCVFGGGGGMRWPSRVPAGAGCLVHVFGVNDAGGWIYVLRCVDTSAAWTSTGMGC
jgi:hypothetical protein